MGEQQVSVVRDDKQMQEFVSHLLDDVQALEYMLDNDWFETDTIRIGAEQEMCLVDCKTLKPAPINIDVMKLMQEHEWCGTELARFNLETNLTPREFIGSCLSDLELENNSYLKIINEKLKGFDARVILTGILPTLRKHDLEMHNLTPNVRYKALMESIDQHLVKSSYELRLEGIDELSLRHGSPLLEACNTSFQVHLQVSPKDFVSMYNIAQALAAPIISIAANSPIVFGKRLWHESRIALFQQALDTRTSYEHLRERSPRVNFGKGWLKKSILEIYKEDIARFRVLLGGEIEEDSIKAIMNGKVPKLKALQVHNSTVYRWNRPCYGISENGMPHLRIENRVLPAGPTVVDEVANAAFWLGAMVGMADQYPDITKKVSYEDIRDNFLKSAQFGIDTKFNWFNDSKVSASTLIKEQLLPIARHGLQLRGVDQNDIDKYLGIIEGRAVSNRNGARWILRTFTRLREEVSSDEALTILTSSIIKNQEKEMPVHTWEEPTADEIENYHPSKTKVEEFMETDLFTVQKDDIIDLVSEMMDWRKIRYMPVEDSQGNLVGLITSRLLLRHFTRRVSQQNTGSTLVKDIMIENPITITPDINIMEALRIMHTHRIGCLPVVNGKELIGVITESDFLKLSMRLMQKFDVLG
ncbi:MAG: CBS domain-containing protein [Saprospiraceae bacterium]|nr:CBS domain-containing protein [Saprospiraceae bacterium]